MDVESGSSGEERRQELKNKYLLRLLPVIKHQGLSHLRIDDIVRFMGISKATFYKYFSSKEDVIEQAVEHAVAYLQEAVTLIGDESSSHLLRFQNAFAQSVLIASYISDIILLDLKQSFPLLWERVKQAQQEQQQQLQQFYKQGIEQGIFNPINPVLTVLQNELLLSNILDPVFLMEHNLTLKGVLYDYYEIQKYQWLPREVARHIDDTPVREYIDMIVRKISLGIRSERRT